MFNETEEESGAVLVMMFQIFGHQRYHGDSPGAKEENIEPATILKRNKAFGLMTAGFWFRFERLDLGADKITHGFLMHQVHGKVSQVSLNVYPMWLLLTYTRPRECYGRICQYKKLI
jgi:hypothetical protein